MISGNLGSGVEGRRDLEMKVRIVLHLLFCLNDL